MGLANELLESMNEGAKTDDRTIMRIISSARTSAEGVQRIAEAYGEGKVSLEHYVAAMGMQRARVLPREPKLFLAALNETIDRVPSHTVAAVETYWVERAKAHGESNMDSLFEALFKKKSKKEEPDEEEDDDETSDEEDAEENEEGE